MPELPEVETIRRQLDQVVPGRTVAAAGAFPGPKFTPALAVRGDTFGDVVRRGKYLLISLHRDRELVLHLGMTGRLTITDTPPVLVGDTLPTPPARAYWVFDDGEVLVFDDARRFGRLAIVHSQDYAELPTLATLGPEPLGPAFTVERFTRDLAVTRRPIKASLLSQKVVAGVGNIYADEALWRARINPVARRISTERAQRLHAAIQAVLREAIDHGGTRLRDYRSLDGDTGTHQTHLDVYGRAGLPCPRCATLLRRRVLDGRGTTWCPTCQPR